MRKILKYLLIGVLFFVAILIATFYGYKSSTLNKLQAEEMIINGIWNSIYKESYTRLYTIEKLLIEANCNTANIKSEIEKNKKYRNINSVEELWNLEYFTNKEYLKVKECLQKNKVNKENIDSLNSGAEELNRLINRYNSAVLNFNKSCSVFPNFLFVKEAGISKKKFYYLEYNKDNDKYYQNKQEVEYWIETGQWK